DVVLAALLVLLGLACVPVLNGAIVTGNSAVYLGRLSALGADKLLSAEVSVVLAHRVCGRNGVVGESVVFGNLANKRCGSFPARHLLAEECMEHRARGVKRLKLVLNVKRSEYVVGVADGKVAAVCVVRSSARLCRG